VDPIDKILLAKSVKVSAILLIFQARIFWRMMWGTNSCHTIYSGRSKTMLPHTPEFTVIPEETARIARAAFPKGNPYMQMG
jgi:hypothetical protein